MVRRWVAGLIAAVLMVSVGGVGFSAFTSTITLNTHDTAGSLTIVWVAPSSHPPILPDVSTDVCSDYLTPTSFTINVTNGGPGNGCTIPASDGIFVENTGTLNGVLTLVNTANTGPCTWLYADNFAPFGGSFPMTISVGQMLPAGGYFVHIFLAPGQGNECQGALGFTDYNDNIVATEGT